MEVRFFFTNLGRAILRAAPYLILASQVVDLLNKGLRDAKSIPPESWDKEEQPLPSNIQ